MQPEISTPVALARLAGAAERLAQRLLFLGSKFAAGLGHIEDVDGFMRLGVDEHHFDIGAAGGYCAGEIV